MARLIRKADADNKLVDALDKKFCKRISNAAEMVEKAKAKLDKCYRTGDNVDIDTYLNVDTVNDGETFLGQYVIDADVGPADMYAYEYFDTIRDAIDEFKDSVNNLINTLKQCSSEYEEAHLFDEY